MPAPTRSSQGGPSGRTVPPARPGEGTRLDALDGMRGAAALGIIVLHVWMFVRGDGMRPGRDTLDVVISQLRLGMPMFFVLSGYLIFRPFAGAALDGRRLPDLRRYATRRVARIVPAYWVIILLTVVVLAAIGHGQRIPAEQLPVFLLFLQNYSMETAGGLNPPTWTVAVEVSFYALVPLMGLAATAGCARLGTLRARRVLLSAACGALIVMGTIWLGQAGFHDADRTVSHILPARMASFAAGMLVAVLVHGRRAGRVGVVALMAAGTALVLLEASARGYGLGPADLRQQLVDTPASLGFACMIAAVALGRVPGMVVFTAGPFRWAGILSYGLYLIHFPVIYVLRTLGPWPDGLWGPVALTLGISTVLAIVSWFALERPAIRWARRRTSPQPSPATAPGPAPDDAWPTGEARPRPVPREREAPVAAGGGD
ncbi:MAG: acyltransferase family protein [Solirubrobacteraceae bacterium]|nr:acyltransferase family protein [Solirubrobacteraceae bacterium]